MNDFPNSYDSLAGYPSYPQYGAPPHSAGPQQAQHHLGGGPAHGHEAQGHVPKHPYQSDLHASLQSYALPGGNQHPGASSNAQAAQKQAQAQHAAGSARQSVSHAPYASQGGHAGAHPGPYNQPPSTPGTAGLPPHGLDSAKTEPPPTPGANKKRKSSAAQGGQGAADNSAIEPGLATPGVAGTPGTGAPAPKKSRTNTPWSPAEELRLKEMRDLGQSWSEIAKSFPNRTEGSVKKHWYKDMHYAEFAENESAALLAAIKEYESSKWKIIGNKLGKPAKACEQYAKEHFNGKV